MGFRFQKRIKILPGITINLSKSGLSTSFGPRGAKVTLGHGQTRTTLGIPGSGISQTSVVKDSTTPVSNSSISAVVWLIIAIIVLLAVLP